MDDAKTTVPMRYDTTTDAMIPVTQEWVHDVQKLFQAFGLARQTARIVITAQEQQADVGKKLHAFLDAWKPEFEQKR